VAGVGAAPNLDWAVLFGALMLFAAWMDFVLASEFISTIDAVFWSANEGGIYARIGR
jgi:hypothetical protein